MNSQSLGNVPLLSHVNLVIAVVLTLQECKVAKDSAIKSSQRPLHSHAFSKAAHDVQLSGG